MSEVLSWLSAIEFRNPSLHARLRASVSLVTSALHVYGGKNELVLSFNGGKDSTGVLHLLRAALVLRAAAAAGADVEKNEGGNAAAPMPLAPAASEAGYGDGVLLGGVRVVYFAGSAERDFQEVTDFMSQCERRWRFRVERLGDFRVGLTELVTAGARGVLMGTRGGDPDARSLCGPFAPTTSGGGWPPVMRVNPLLNVSYVQLWAFLRGAKLDTCCLYEKGYTSLGDIDSSVPNPALKVGVIKTLLTDVVSSCVSVCSWHGLLASATVCYCAANADVLYLPAWELLDGDLERAGREKGRK